MRELVEAPGHLVVQMKDLSQPPRFASIVEGKVCERVGWDIRFLGAEHAEEASRHAARVRLKRANRNACERGFAATVVAQKAAPALWEGDIYVVQDGFRGARIGVAHVRKGNLHRHVFLVGVVLGAMGLLANRCGRGLRRHSAAAGYERQMNKWLNMSSRCARYPVPPRRTDGVATRAAGPHALLGQRRQYTALPARAQCQNCRMGAASI